MELQLVFFLSGILVVGSVLFFLIANSKKCKKKIDVDHFRTKCLEIEHQLKQDEASSYQLCVINGDKLVDHAMKCLGIKGKTMAERLKAASGTFSNNGEIWSAHKLRNQIAHESNVKVTYEQAHYALKGFRRALKDLGAI